MMIQDQLISVVESFQFQALCLSAFQSVSAISQKLISDSDYIFWRGMLWAKEELIRFLRRRWIRMIAISSLKLNNKKHLNVNMFRIEYLCLILTLYSCFISDMTFPTSLVKII